MRRGRKSAPMRKDAHDDLYYEMKFDEGEDKWMLRKEGNKQVLDSADTKKGLLRSAREHAESRHAHLKIYHVDGSLEVESDYTRDSPDFHYGR